MTDLSTYEKYIKIICKLDTKVVKYTQNTTQFVVNYGNIEAIKQDSAKEFTMIVKMSDIPAFTIFMLDSIDAVPNRYSYRVTAQCIIILDEKHTSFIWYTTASIQCGVCIVVSKGEVKMDKIVAGPLLGFSETRISDMIEIERSQLQKGYHAYGLISDIRQYNLIWKNWAFYSNLQAELMGFKLDKNVFDILLSICGYWLDNDSVEYIVQLLCLITQSIHYSNDMVCGNHKWTFADSICHPMNCHKDTMPSGDAEDHTLFAQSVYYYLKEHYSYLLPLMKRYMFFVVTVKTNTTLYNTSSTQAETKTKDSAKPSKASSSTSEPKIIDNEKNVDTRLMCMMVPAALVIKYWIANDEDAVNELKLLYPLYTNPSDMELPTVLFDPSLPCMGTFYSDEAKTPDAKACRALDTFIENIERTCLNLDSIAIRKLSLTPTQTDIIFKSPISHNKLLRNSLFERIVTVTSNDLVKSCNRGTMVIMDKQKMLGCDMRSLYLLEDRKKLTLISHVKSKITKEDIQLANLLIASTSFVFKPLSYVPDKDAKLFNPIAPKFTEIKNRKSSKYLLTVSPAFINEVKTNQHDALLIMTNKLKTFWNVDVLHNFSIKLSSVSDTLFCFLLTEKPSFSSSSASN